MSGPLSRLFGGNDNSGADIEVLRDLLMEREATLDLTAVYGEPSANTQGEPTAAFPYTTYSDRSKYSKGAKEFVIPDDGLSDTDGPLVQFIAKRHGIAPEDVDFGALAGVEDTEASADLNDDGDVVVA